MVSIKRKIDKLGRVVLPIGYRKELGLGENEAAIITLEKDTIIIKRAKAYCKMCSIVLPTNSSMPLCLECAKTVALQFSNSK